jgi:hypothetical protein
MRMFWYFVGVAATAFCFIAGMYQLTFGGAPLDGIWWFLGFAVARWLAPELPRAACDAENTQA